MFGRFRRIIRARKLSPAHTGHFIFVLRLKFRRLTMWQRRYEKLMVEFIAFFFVYSYSHAAYIDHGGESHM